MAPGRELSVAVNNQDYPTSGIVKELGEDHPLYLAFKRNETNPFLSLPLEIRIMIYEYAVAINKKVTVQHVTYGSNKFLWGETTEVDWDGVRTWASAETQPLAAVCLSRTCRQTYQELERYPVFYRVNTFQFKWIRVDASIDNTWRDECLSGLAEFLSAITPARRAMVRRVEIAFDINGPFGPLFARSVAHERDDRRDFNVLALLSQCKDLRELSSLLPCEYGRADVILRDCLLGALKPHDIPLLWNLPFLRVKVFMNDGSVLSLGDSATIQPSSSFRFDQISRSNQNCIIQINSAMFARYRGDKWPQWLKDMDNPVLVERAVSAQDVDMYGEDRLLQDITQRTGNISSRLRRKEWFYDPSHGVLQRDTPQYAANGVLAWKYQKVTGIRFNDSSDIECEMLWFRPTRVPEKSWVPAQALWTDEREWSLRNYYENAGILDRETSPEILAPKMKNTPSPESLLNYMAEVCGSDMAQAFGVGDGQRAKGRVNVIKKKWECLQRKWKARIVRAEKEILAQEKKKKRQERAEAREEAQRRKAERMAKGKAKNKAE
ncbi:hypothetical protein F4776DRAFT_658580 [Hypoxylon sp. NC0597]|nr:hypothetical protein F4776DRAFT_658580 [Hypoxylon sp. NC0597]